MEALDEVERAFVHVDYKQRDEPEHKVERNLQQGARNLFSAHDSVRHQVTPRGRTLFRLSLADCQTLYPDRTFPARNLLFAHDSVCHQVTPTM